MLLSFTAFVVLVGVLIFVHEAGHFLAAKAMGVQVLRFSLGFGPPLLKTTRNGTEYWLCVVPLGGYVKMAGLEDEGMAGELEGGASATPVDPERAFDRKSIPARMFIMVAGVGMNLVLACLVFSVLGMTHGRRELGTTTVDSVTADELPAGAEALASLHHGSRIVRVNDDSVATWEDVLRAVIASRDSVRFGVAGVADPVTARVGDSAGAVAIARAIVPAFPVRVGIVQPGRPARHAGVRTGDEIVRVDGDSMRSWAEFLHRVRPAAGRPLSLEVLRDGERLTFTVTPDSQPTTDSAGVTTVQGFIGVQVREPTIYIRQPFGTAIANGFGQTAASSLAILNFLGRLFTGAESVGELGGPILIGQISGQMVRLGVFDFLFFLAFFSVQLAVLNLLPIPVLDGGHVVFLLAEAIRGKPVPLVWRVRLLNFGFVVLMGIIALALGNDVLRFFR